MLPDTSHSTIPTEATIATVKISSRRVRKVMAVPASSQRFSKRHSPRGVMPGAPLTRGLTP